jgi:hypothetical protein
MEIVVGPWLTDDPYRQHRLQSPILSDFDGEADSYAAGVILALGQHGGAIGVEGLP